MMNITETIRFLLLMEMGKYDEYPKTVYMAMLYVNYHRKNKFKSQEIVLIINKTPQISIRF